MPPHVRCEALLIERLDEAANGRIRLDPRVYSHWQADPSQVVGALVRFKPGLAWVGEVSALLRGYLAGRIEGDSSARYLSLDGWSAARMMRSLEEIRMPGNEGYDWLARNSFRLHNSLGESRLDISAHMRRLERAKALNQLIVAKVELVSGVHEVFGLFREAAGRIGGLVARPALYSRQDGEHLLIALPPSQFHSIELLQRIARIERVRSLTLELYTAKDFSDLAHEDATWILQKPYKNQPLYAEPELDASSKRFSLLELDQRVAKEHTTPEERDPSSIRFSLIELD